MNSKSVLDKEVKNFIEHIIADDLTSGKHQGIITRFPPEPNGYLHFGHAKSICLNFGLSRDNPNAVCHLRFDDTNPEKEEQEYVNSIMEDVKWLGFDWGKNLFYASDYYEKLYQYAVELIEKSLAYVDDQSAEEIRETRGTLDRPGTDSPYRNRSVEENLGLFRSMREGKFGDGEKVLRAKIDMNSPNINLRDPVIYRIKRAHHQRTGDAWCIYPMYDFAHPLSDALEKITHSLCTLEFEDHRPLYDWLTANTTVPARPQQIEFARLNVNYTVMSKRRLVEMVETKVVEGWDDPRMPTLSGMRRRGITPAAIRNFCEYIGVGKKETIIDIGVFEQYVRDDLKIQSNRTMAVMNPIKVVITNWDEQKPLKIAAPLHPDDESRGTTEITLEREIYIEATDFMQDPPSPKKWYRLGPNLSVRLRYGPIITCHDFIKNEVGEVVELHCTYSEGTFHGATTETSPKVKAIIHWAPVKSCKEVEVRLFDRLFTVENPTGDKSKNYLEFINPESLKIVKCKVHPGLLKAKKGEHYQFERTGYFYADPLLSKDGAPVFNRVVKL